MLKIISRPLSKIFNKLGYSISPVNNIIAPAKGPNWAEKLNIRTIIDIGSNEGQFIKKINKSLPGRKIYAFEPIPDCYQKIITAQNPLVTAFNIGLSDKEGFMEINISNNSASSSFLDMKELHKENFPESVFIKKEKVVLKQLDDVLADYQLEKNILIKVDVQGYEEKVISGGKNTFNNASALIMECIFEPFYENQWLFDDIYNHLNNAGFKFMGFTEQETSPKTGIPLFADALFIKKEMVKEVL